MSHESKVQIDPTRLIQLEASRLYTRTHTFFHEVKYFATPRHFQHSTRQPESQVQIPSNRVDSKEGKEFEHERQYG